MKKLLILSITAIVALGLMGCETIPENNNKDAKVVDANKTVDTNKEVVKTDKDDDWSWDNDMKREDFDKDKDKYTKQREEKYKDDTVGSGANDLWLWTKTRAALATTDDLGDATINVDVEKEVVTLKGTVDSDAKKKQAVEVAGKVEGVKSVTDKLTINKDDSPVDGADTEKTEMDGETKKEEKMEKKEEMKDK